MLTPEEQDAIYKGTLKITPRYRKGEDGDMEDTEPTYYDPSTRPIDR